MDGKIVGSLDDSKVYQSLIEKPELRDAPISTIMQDSFPIVKEEATIEDLSKLINKDVAAVIVELKNGHYHIVTRHDLIAAIA